MLRARAASSSCPASRGLDNRATLRLDPPPLARVGTMPMTIANGASDDVTRTLAVDLECIGAS